MRRYAGLLIAVGAGLLSLAGAEVVLRHFLPFPDPYTPYKARKAYIPSAFEPDQRMVFEVEEGLPGMPRQAVFSTNNLGFRGDLLRQPKPADEFRIFVVGGSTTECLYLDDSLTVTRRLQDRLTSRGAGRSVRHRVAVYNAGKSGDKSYDHVAMIAHRIVHLQPDLLVVFAGVNDLIAAVGDADYLLRNQGNRLALGELLKYAATEFQLPRHVHAALKGNSEQEVMVQIPLRSDYRQKIAVAQSVAPSYRPPRTDVGPYAQNLRSLIGIARAHGIGLVLMTQASTWNSAADPTARQWHWLTYLSGTSYREEHLDRALERYNDTMRQLAAEHGLPLFDLAKAIPKSTRYFYDDVHFNVAGADTTARLLADFIAAHRLLEPEP